MTRHHAFFSHRRRRRLVVHHSSSKRAALEAAVFIPVVGEQRDSGGQFSPGALRDWTAQLTKKQKRKEKRPMPTAQRGRTTRAKVILLARGRRPPYWSLTSRRLGRWLKERLVEGSLVGSFERENVESIRVDGATFTFFSAFGKNRLREYFFLFTSFSSGERKNLLSNQLFPSNSS